MRLSDLSRRVKEVKLVTDVEEFHGIRDQLYVEVLREAGRRDARKLCLKVLELQEVDIPLWFS